MTFEKVVKILITKLGDSRRNRESQPMTKALYETYLIVKEKEKVANG